MIIRVGYKELFNKSANINKLLSNIEIETSLELLAIINKYEYKIYNSDLSDLNFICNEWLIKSSNDFKKKLIDYYSLIVAKNIGYGDTIKNVKTINKATTLRAMELILYESNRRAKQVSDIENKEENLFLFYLAINDEFVNREIIPFDKYLDFTNNKKFLRFNLYLGLQQLSMNSESISKKIWVEALKFVLFEKWITDQTKYNNFISEYLDQFDVQNWYELFSIIFSLNQLAISDHKFKPDTNDSRLKFFKYISKHKDNSDEWNDYSEIRKNPLYELANQNYLILDFPYLLDKLFSGIYHDIIEKANQGKAKSFHQDFSRDFVEKYLLVNTLKAVFGKNYIQFDENRIKENNFKGIDNLALPDYYVRNGNKIFLFECKNSFISHKAKLEISSDIIEDEMVDKFYSSGNKKKAIRQLMNFIHLSQNEKYAFFDKNPKLSKCIYYPILITTDLTLTSLAFNKLLNEYAEQDIDPLDLSLKQRIKPITIIHINDLLIRTTSLKKIDLLIDEYYRHCNSQKEIDSMISFSDFLDKIKFKKTNYIDHNSFKAMLHDSILPYSK